MQSQRTGAENLHSLWFRAAEAAVDVSAEPGVHSALTETREQLFPARKLATCPQRKALGTAEREMPQAQASYALPRTVQQQPQLLPLLIIHHAIGAVPRARLALLQADELDAAEASDARKLAQLVLLTV